ANADMIRRFYSKLLDMPWLSPRMRHAVMAEVSGSVRAYNRGIEYAKTAVMRKQFNDRKARLRNEGRLPRGGIHEAAVEEEARIQGMTVESLKKRLQRYKQK